MTDRTAQAWWSDWQRSFAAAVRRPLDGSSGTLQSVLLAGEDGLVDSVPQVRADGVGTAMEPASNPLALYNRQYWLRLFSVLQAEMPLTARLLGFWRFNHAAQAFLTKHPPNSGDLAACADGFAEFLPDYLARPDARLVDGSGAFAAREAAVVEAAALVDAAWRLVLSAPRQRLWNADASQSPMDLNRRLQQSPAAAFLTEQWPLVALRQQLPPGNDERAVAIPEAYPAPAHWAICCRGSQVVALPLEFAQAQLYELLANKPLGTALASWEQRYPAATASAARWLRLSVELGFWLAI